MFFDSNMSPFMRQVVQRCKNQGNGSESFNSGGMNCWITKLKDQTLVSNITIPGTHDSAAYKTVARGYCAVFNKLGSVIGRKFIECQQASQFMQLNRGIRYFDLRLCYDRTNESGKWEEFHFHHGPFYCGSPDDAFKMFKSFLQYNSKEFLILQIQQQNSKVSSSFFGQKFLSYFKKFEIPYFDWNNKIPTVGELRGKVWLIQAAHVQMAQMEIDTDQPVRDIIYGNNYILQNLWEASNKQVSNGKKIECIKNHINADNKDGKLLKINYISMQSVDKGFYNTYLQEILDQNEDKFFGIIVMDKPRTQLIEKIYNKNFPSIYSKY